MLEIKDLQVVYSGTQGASPALEGLGLSLAPREVCTVVGPSGGGKSTLLGAIAGIVPYQGSITLSGEPIDSHRHQIALVPQSYGLLPWQTVETNIRLPQRLGRRYADDATYSDIITRLGLTSLLGRYPHQLSGGQRQRVALARAFAMLPDLMLMDEPFAALDIVTAERSRELLADLWHRYPTTALVVTHSPTDAALLGHRTLVLGGRPGRIIYEGYRADAQTLHHHLSQCYAETD